MQLQEETHENIQQILDENAHIIKVIMKSQNEGRMMDCMLYQTRLQLNLIQLAALADNRPHPSIGTQESKSILENSKKGENITTDTAVFIRAVKENGMCDLELISKITQTDLTKVKGLCHGYIDFLRRQNRAEEANKFENDLSIYHSKEVQNNYNEDNLIDDPSVKPLE
ncbi:hypothetical protein TRFO_11159 [Tritrichomonas foetus]|uniref:SS18 N-terminal domain-containing protein n=1 Tax=Tritrichomonas foetus TaxID=1144522 RepID=A0A1J4J6N4_9EUKA|nr:hypothetical protein TRFO_11159 [Tritrichomonas foetus]|eukprot:OHS94313.1 hypothetical protein TRFO_11159 [Tritrichomonas foetus]